MRGCCCHTIELDLLSPSYRPPVINPITGVSSANVIRLLFPHLVTQSNVNKLYNRGLRQQPWGAPVLVRIVDEHFSPMRTHWGLPVRKSNSQLQIELPRPRLLSFNTSLDGTIERRSDVMSLDQEVKFFIHFSHRDFLK